MADAATLRQRDAWRKSGCACLFCVMGRWVIRWAEGTESLAPPEDALYEWKKIFRQEDPEMLEMIAARLDKLREERSSEPHVLPTQGWRRRPGSTT